MNKRIILVGAGGSGKNYFLEYLRKKGFVVNVSYTTRPIRVKEIDGMDYNFIDDEAFDMMIRTDFFQEHTEFNSWKYGTSKASWDRSDVFIKTPSGIKTLSEKDRQESTVIYFNIDEDIRRERIKKRNDGDAERRIKSDNKDFKNFTDFDIEITNPRFNNEEILSRLQNRTS